MKEPKKEDRQVIRAMSLLFQLGLNMAVCIGMGLFIGKFLDDWLGTMPVFLIIFLIMGILAAFRNMFKMLSKF